MKTTIEKKRKENIVSKQNTFQLDFNSINAYPSWKKPRELQVLLYKDSRDYIKKILQIICTETEKSGFNQIRGLIPRIDIGFWSLLYPQNLKRQDAMNTVTLTGKSIKLVFSATELHMIESNFDKSIYNTLKIFPLINT